MISYLGHVISGLSRESSGGHVIDGVGHVTSQPGVRLRISDVDVLEEVGGMWGREGRDDVRV